MAIFKGVESDSAVINSSSEVVATFSNGIPVSEAADDITLRFDHSSLNEQLVSFQNSVTLSKALDLIDSTGGMVCSFQGGCAYSVQASGLTSSLLDSETNSIDVCGNPCVVDAANSDSTQMTCSVPHITTAYSAASFEVVISGVISDDGTWTGSASDSELAKLIDNKNMVDMVDDTNADCYFQIQFKEAHVGVLEEVKFFINEMFDKTPYVGGLVFQGSDDGASFTDLWTIDASVHEGWNSHDFD